MHAVLGAVVLGLLAFFIHVAIWRIHRPGNSGFALLGVFVAVAAVASAAIAAWIWQSGASMNGPALAQAALLYFAGMAAYINTYPAIEADSPSLLLAHDLRSAGVRGLTRPEILARFSDDLVFLPRVRNLLDEKMAEIVDGRFRLTAKGRAIARIFSAFRRLTGRGLGG